MDILDRRAVPGRQGSTHGCEEESYTPKYRQEAARLANESGRTITAVAEEIGVGPQLLSRWVSVKRSMMYDGQIVAQSSQGSVVRALKHAAHPR